MATSPRTGKRRAAGGEAGRRDGTGKRADRERALRRRGPAGDEGAEPARPGGGGGGRDDDRDPAGDLGHDKRGDGQRQPWHRGDRRDLDKQYEHERADPHGADVGAAHDLKRDVRGAAAAEPVGGIGEPVEVQAAGEHGDHRDRERRPEQPPGPGGVQRARGQHDTAADGTEQQPYPRQPEDRPGRHVVVERPVDPGGDRREEAQRDPPGGRVSFAHGCPATAAAWRCPRCTARPARSRRPRGRSAGRAHRESGYQRSWRGSRQNRPRC